MTKSEVERTATGDAPVESPFEAFGKIFGASGDSVEALVRINALLSDPRFARAMAAIREEDAGVRAESEAPTIR